LQKILLADRGIVITYPELMNYVFVDLTLPHVRASISLSAGAVRGCVGFLIVAVNGVRLRQISFANLPAQCLSQVPALN
jgi:hypothetical protein